MKETILSRISGWIDENSAILADFGAVQPAGTGSRVNTNSAKSHRLMTVPPPTPAHTAGTQP